MGRIAFVAGACVAAIAVASTASGAPASPQPALALQITYDARSLPLHYTLSCEPTSGTLARAAAACTAIAANPKMVLGEPPPPYEGPRPLRALSCPAPDQTLQITGTYHGRAVDTTASDSCWANRTLALWAPFLPAPESLHEVRVDRGLDALGLGQTHAAVSALLGAPMSHRAGAALYTDGSDLTVHVAVPDMFAVAYDAHRRVTTLISNQLTPLDRSLVLQTGPRQRPISLKHWHKVICAGRHSLADHPLTRRRATTIIWPSIDHPTAIVTTQPLAACLLAKATEQAPLPSGQIVH